MERTRVTARPVTRRIVTVVLYLMALSLLHLPMEAQQPMRTRHVRQAVLTGEAALQHQLASTEVMKLAIVLPLRNQSELDALLQDLYNPSSPSYHQWLSVQEFTERFGPSAAAYEAVVAFAEQNGMTVTARTPNRMVVDVQAPAAVVEKTFHVTMGVYKHPTENRTFFAPDREPSINPSIQLWYVAGLDNFSRPTPHLRFAQTGSVHTFTTGSGPGGTFLGSDIRAAYYGGTALTGAGQTIGLFGLNYNISDVEKYYSSIGQSFNPSSVQNYSTDGTTNSCGSGCDDGEPVIDIYEALSMAPSATIVEYFGNSDVDTFNAMATANVAKQLSASVGWLPSDPASDEPIFKEFAAQGQNLFAAADDSGAYSSTTPAYYPADDPYVTSAGGSDLITNGASGAWQSESAWVGGGGGISTNGFAIPSYQKLSGVINSANGGSTTLRNVPDVAAEANTDNYYCANGGCYEGVGGTSLAAPRWAGFMALVNQQAANNGRSSVGFLNPLIYSIGTSSSYSTDFHDITSGNNGDGSGKSYSAVTGYDLATGWGSPNGQNLINALVGTTTGFSLSASSQAVTIVAGSSGSSSITVSSLNGFASATTMSVGGLPSGVSATFATNPITPTANGSVSSSLTFAVTAAAATGTSTVVVTAKSGSLAQSISITLSVTPASVVGGNNIDGVYSDGSTFAGGGLDGNGYAYSSNLLGSSLAWNGTMFTFGAANTANAYSSETVSLPSGHYATLNLLATGVNGNQAAQSFIVTYTDGTTTTITQSLSDWFTPQSYSGEATAMSMAYRDVSNGTKDNRTFNLYGYSFAINSSKVLKSITLPSNRNVIVLAVVPILNGTHTLTPQNATSMDLDDWASGTGSGNQIDIWPANGTGAQSWVFSNSVVTPAGYYNVAVSLGSYCMTASGSSSGSLVNLQPCSGTSAQAWEAVISGNYFVLHPANNTSLCLDVQGAGTAAETLVQVLTCNSGSNEQWAVN